MIRTAALALLTLVLAIASADAVTLARLSFAQLTADADVVVYGRVSGVRGQWTADRHGIESLVTVEAYDYLKGRYGETVMFKTPGGQVGDTMNVWPGAPTFRAGDLVVVFLASRGPTIPSLVGLTQGVLRVSVDARSGELLARPRPAGLADGSRQVSGGASTITVTALTAHVRAQMEAGR